MFLFCTWFQPVLTRNLKYCSYSLINLLSTFPGMVSFQKLDLKEYSPFGQSWDYSVISFVPIIRKYMLPKFKGNKHVRFSEVRLHLCWGAMKVLYTNTLHVVVLEDVMGPV